MIFTRRYIDARVSDLQREITVLRDQTIEHLQAAQDVIHRPEYDKKHEELASETDKVILRVTAIEETARGFDQFRTRTYAFFGAAIGVITIIIFIIDRFVK